MNSMNYSNSTRTLFLFIFAVATAFFAPSVKSQAQIVRLDSLNLQVRGDYQHESVDGEELRDANGFKGKFFNFIMRARIGDKMTFSYRQRINKTNINYSFFDATDWLTLDYKFTDQFSMAAGKQIVGIGGYEYDKAPIDVYYASEYWNNIRPYQWGVSATFGLRGGKDSFMAQFCQSPFRGEGQDTYAYNVMWMGNHGVWKTLWSVNAIEYAQGKFIGYVALGNAFDLGRFHLELDFMNRTVEGEPVFFRDCSVMGELAYRPTSKLTLLAKATYDVNKANHAGDFCIQPGTEITRVGAGAEFYPLGNRTLRLHANGAYTFGHNGNPAGTLQDKHLFLDCGITWNVNLLRLTK